MTSMTAKCHCQNCEWTGTYGQTGDITEIWLRVEPGEIMPAGECPSCGSLASLDHTDLQAKSDLIDDLAKFEITGDQISDDVDGGPYEWTPDFVAFHDMVDGYEFVVKQARQLTSARPDGFQEGGES